MEKHKKILATLDKARTGARVLEKDWDQKIVPRTLKQIAKKYNLLGMDYAYNGTAQLHREDLSTYQKTFIENGIDAFF